MKYVGGKYKTAPRFLPYILKERESEDQWYVEPFIGGANVMWNVTGNRIGSDSNPYVIALLKAVRDGNWPPPKLSREQWKRIKDNPEKYSRRLVGWAGVGCSFSGTWFGAYSGCTVTPSISAGFKDYQQEFINQGFKQGPHLKGCLLIHSDYRNLDIPNNSIIYCDPPYDNVSQPYLGLDNNNFNQKEFYEWCEDMNRSGHKVFVSEHSINRDWELLWEHSFRRTLGTASEGVKVTDRLFRVRRDQ